MDDPQEKQLTVDDLTFDQVEDLCSKLYLGCALPFASIITFGCWGYSIFHFGWFLGLALGWIPSAIVGFLAACLLGMALGILLKIAQRFRLALRFVSRAAVGFTRLLCLVFLFDRRGARIVEPDGKGLRPDSKARTDQAASQD